MFYPIQKNWRHKAATAVIIRDSTYRCLDSYWTADEGQIEKACALGRLRLGAAAGGRDSLPSKVNTVSAPLIEAWLRDPESALVSLVPVDEQTEKSITVNPHHYYPPPLQPVPSRLPYMHIRGARESGAG